MTSPLTTAYQVRLRIQDLPRQVDITRHGDGTGTRYHLEHRNITSGTAYVAPGGTAWSATAGSVFNASGFVDLSGVVSANSAVRFVYVHSVFSDNEIGHYTAAGGDIPGAAIQAVRALRFDGLRRASWAAPDGTEYDDTAALTELDRLEKSLRREIEDAAFAAGSIESWSENQADYT